MLKAEFGIQLLGSLIFLGQPYRPAVESTLGDSRRVYNHHSSMTGILCNPAEQVRD